MKMYSYSTHITFMQGTNNSPHHLAVSGDPTPVSMIYGDIIPPGLDPDEEWNILLNAEGHCADVLYGLTPGKWEVPGIGDVLVIGKEITTTYGRNRLHFDIYLRIRQEPTREVPTPNEYEGEE